MQIKMCFKCNEKKELQCFYRHPQMPDGYVNKCKECNKKDVRENFAKKREYYNTYDKDRIRNNINYIFIHRYAGILARTEGRVGKRTRTYKVTGMPVATRSDFLDWCYKKENLKKFMKLHKRWKESNYDRKLTPCVDRIDENGSYTTDNIQWLITTDNIKKYYTSKANYEKTT